MARFFAGIVGSLVVVVAIVCLVGPTNAQVRTKLDNINVDRYLENKQLVEEHVRCLVYSGPCDAIANEIKRLFYTYRYTGITTSRCSVCSPEQEAKLNKIAQHWQQHYPEAWRELTTFIAQG